MFLGYISLTVAALIPVVITAILNRAEKAGKLAKLSHAQQQILFGVIFGAVAVLGTEWGIKLDGAVVNCRDAAPLCAGLFFGGPAGIIAGCIGGIERWFSVYWGVGYYTRLACTVATILSGLAGALLRKHIFEERRPKLVLAFACTFFVETLHLSMVFFMHIDDAATAAATVRACAPAMLTANSFSVLLAGVVSSYQDGTLFRDRSQRLSLSILVERRLLVAVVISFIFTTAFALRLQTEMANTEARGMLRQSLDVLKLSLDSPEVNGYEEALALCRKAGRSEHEMTLLILDGQNRLCASTGEIAQADLDALLQNGVGEYAACRLANVNSRALSARHGDLLLFAVLPASDVYSTRNISSLATCFVQFFIYGLLFTEIYIDLRKTVLNSIYGMNDTLHRITDGDLNARVEERTSQEFSQLSDGINATVDSLNMLFAAEKAHNEQELRVAREIQLSALPNVFPAYPNRKDLDIYALTQPAREVGGDFYDFYFTGPDRFCILAADVSGKGIPAAMFMMRAKTQLKGLAEAGKDIEEVFRLGNRSLCEGNEAEMFVTAWMADIDMKTGEASFANAGHNPPVLLKKDGSCAFLKTRPSFVLAGMEGTRYKKDSLRLSPGDRLVLYTDGVTEAVDPLNEQFGEERLLAVIRENASLPAAELSKKITEAVAAFAGEAEQFDDITLLIFDYFGSGTKAEKRFEAACIEDIPAATEFLETELEKAGCPQKVIFAMDTALDEIFSNIVRYGYPDAPGPVTLTLETTDAPRSLTLTFTDEGTPFDPLERSDPDVTGSADERTPGGLGIFLVKKMMDDVSYEYTGGKNILRLRKNF